MGDIIEATPQAVTNSNGAALAPPRSLGQLAGALAKAQAAVEAVPHDRRNDYHKYDYTSAEAIIREGKRALSASGLALVPVDQTLNGWEREGENRFELCRRFLLLHASGESCPVMVTWPVVPDRGRPLDKAVASAATTSLAYLLRDLLLMPRVDEADDLAGREDRPAAKPAPVKAPDSIKKTAKALPADGKELLARLKAYDARLSAEGVCKAGEFVADVAREGKRQHDLSANVEEWGAVGIQFATDFVKDFEARRKAG